MYHRVFIKNVTGVFHNYNITISRHCLFSEVVFTMELNENLNAHIFFSLKVVHIALFHHVLWVHRNAGTVELCVSDVHALGHCPLNISF